MKEKISAGLDIGTSAVKIVKLKFVKENIEIYGFHSEPLQEDLSGLIKNIAQSQSLDKVNISVSGPSAIIRYATFPMMDEEELKQALKFEGQKHIPFPVAEVNMDGYILKKDLPDSKMLVLLAAVKKDLVGKRIKFIEDAGLKINAIDMDSLALVNAFNHNYSGEEALKAKTVALLNIGASMSNLNILEDGIPRLSRDIYSAGNNVTQKIQDAFALDLKSAEEFKLYPDKISLDKLMKVVEAALSNLAAEIRVSFDYYESQSASSVGEIFLSGGGSACSGLSDILANAIGVPVRYWDPLKRINSANGIDAEKLKPLSAQLAVAVGLALRS